jgi:hypothetical protein
MSVTNTKIVEGRHVE